MQVLLAFGIVTRMCSAHCPGYTVKSRNTLTATPATEFATRRQLLKEFLPIACIAAVGALPRPALAVKANIKRDTNLNEELYQILRVQEAASQQGRLVKTGKYRDLQRLNIKRGVKMMIDNYDLEGRFVRASAFAPGDKVQTATSYGQTAVEGLIQILEYFPNELNAIDLTRDQTQFVLAALSSTSKTIDSFLLLMPSDQVAVAKARLDEENALNLKEFPEGSYLNAPEIAEQ